MKVYKIIYIFTVLYTFFWADKLLLSQSKIELSFHLGYSAPLLETYGTNLVLYPGNGTVTILGKRWINSDNLGAEKGYTVQTYFKYSFVKSGFLKGLFSLGYNNLNSSHSGPGDTAYGVRVQSFSIGIGPEINPIGERKFYPSLFALLRLNLVGGETYYHAGLDFFKVSSRYGYTGGFKLNYKFNNKTGIYLGYSYSYDNTWGKLTEETTPQDFHVIVFRDKASPTNGLSHDRRIAYASYYLGMNFYFK